MRIFPDQPTDAMHLYHHPLSSNARRAVMTALHLGPLLPEPVQLELVDLTTGAQHAPAFTRLNPAARVPALTHGDFVLTESHAIMIYLAEAAPGQNLWPAPAQARADVNRWLFWNAAHFTPAVSALNWQHFVKRLVTGEDPDVALVAQGEAEFKKQAALLDHHLQGRTWVSGQAMTLADLALAAMLMHEHTARLPLDGLSNIHAWWARVRELPVWQATEPPPMGPSA